MRRGYNHPLSTSLGVQLDATETALALKQLRAGDKSVEHTLVMSKLRLGMTIVARFAVSAPNQIEDMVSEAAFATIHAIRLLASMPEEHSNPEAYISRTISGTLLRFLRKDNVLPKGLQRIEVNDFTGKDSGESDNELIIKCIRTDQERRIIDMRLLGMLDPEIGKIMGITKQRVSQIRAIIAIRVQNEFRRDAEHSAR